MKELFYFIRFINELPFSLNTSNIVALNCLSYSVDVTNVC